jgi:hypothetical protein
MQFRRERIDRNPPCGQLAFCLTEDLTGNGQPDVVIGGLGRRYEITPLGKKLVLKQLPVVGDVLRRFEWNVFWYENPGWERHNIVQVPDLAVGASLADLTGDRRSDLVVGQTLGSNLYWFEQPADPREPWPNRLITDEFTKYHDTAVGDIDDDGEQELVVLSQRSETVFYYDIPEDPRQSPWPVENRHTIADDLSVEGVAVSDIDGDGVTELVAGQNVFSHDGTGWEREIIAPGWEWTRIGVADLDGDGQQEIVLSEGDRPYHDDNPGRVGWYDPETDSLQVLEDDLYCPHTLQVVDFTGDTLPDIYVAEMGLGNNEQPLHIVYVNNGDRTFEREVIARGVPTHEAKAVDLTGDGLIDIVGKSYTPSHHVDAWFQSA